MDNSIIRKTSFYRDLCDSQRQFPSGLPVRSVGYLPEKSNLVKRRFDRISFMFMLKGTGSYRRGSDRQELPGPCVIVGLPNTEIEYGPDRTWEVLYFNYVSALEPVVFARGLASRERPVWLIRQVSLIRRLGLELLQAVPQADRYGGADRIDRLCESLIVESLIDADAPRASRQNRILQDIRTYLDQHYREELNLDDLALEFGLSPSHFRRGWAEQAPVPPSQYVTRLRIREACRLLVETSIPAAKIAAQVGYEDPLYFYRRFRQITGETAASYRRSAGIGPGQGYRE